MKFDVSKLLAQNLAMACAIIETLVEDPPSADNEATARHFLSAVVEGKAVVAPRWKATATAPHVGSQHLIEITSITGSAGIIGGHLRLTDAEATDLLAILARCPEFTTLDARPAR